jgi:hypothetical protein
MSICVVNVCVCVCMCRNEQESEGVTVSVSKYINTCMYIHRHTQAKC